MTEGFKPVKAYRMPMDVYIGDPSKPSEMTMIKEGQPVVKVQFAKTDIGRDLWNKRKAGRLMGVSIGAKGKRVPNPNYVARKGEGGYVSVKLHKEDAETIQSWLKSLNISETIKSEDLHATLYYAEKGMPVLDIDKEKVYMADVSGSPIEMGDKDSEWYAITLPVSSDSLTKRHSFIKEYTGSDHSYKDYKPHLSLKYKPSPEDIAKIKGSTLPLKTLRFYKESQEDLV